jgi:hypothetical protein
MKNLRRFRRYLFLPLVFAPLAWLFSCATSPSVKEKVSQEMKAEPAHAMGGEVAAAGHRLILDAEGLEPQQKEKLLALHGRMAGEIVGIRNDMGRLKMLLFKAMTDPKGDQKELNHIKNRILRLDRERTSKMLSALEEAQTILGRRSFEDERIYRALMMERVADYER